MDTAELKVLWQESQDEAVERARASAERSESDRQTEERRREKAETLLAEEQERERQVEQQRQENLPVIIEANKSLHAKQLEVLKRIIALPLAESHGTAVGGDLVSSARRKNVVTTKTAPLGQIEEGIEARAEIALFQVQHANSLGQTVVRRKLWSEPEPRRIIVRLIADGPGVYRELDSFTSVSDLRVSSRIVSASPEELSDLRMPDENCVEDIENISSILDMIEERASASEAKDA